MAIPFTAPAPFAFTTPQKITGPGWKRTLTPAQANAMLTADTETGRLSDDVKAVTARSLIKANLADDMSSGVYLTPGRNGSMAAAVQLREAAESAQRRARQMSDPVFIAAEGLGRQDDAAIMAQRAGGWVYVPGMSRVGEGTPQDRPALFTDAEVLGEVKYLMMINRRHATLNGNALRTAACNRLLAVLGERRRDRLGRAALVQADGARVGAWRVSIAAPVRGVGSFSLGSGGLVMRPAASGAMYESTVVLSGRDAAGKVGGFLDREDGVIVSRGGGRTVVVSFVGGGGGGGWELVALGDDGSELGAVAYGAPVGYVACACCSLEMIGRPGERCEGCRGGSGDGSGEGCDAATAWHCFTAHCDGSGCSYPGECELSE